MPAPRSPMSKSRRPSAPSLRERAYLPPRLRDLLDTRLQTGMLFVQAPAGCGKTAAILQFLLDAGSDVRWYTCSPDEADPADLLIGLVRAMGGDDSVAGQTTIAALLSRDARRAYRAALKPFLNELNASVADGAVLVVDDVDPIASRPDSVEVLDYLVRTISPPMRVALISRAELPLGSQAKRLLEGRAARVLTEDLLFRSDEIVALARDGYGIDLSPNDGERLYRATGGWAIATCLALRLRQMGTSLKREEDAHFTPEARADLFAYLAAEVLSRTDDRVERFLRETAILETLDPAVCERLTGQPRPAELIQSLAAAGLPVTKAGWSAYRCHSLLRDYFLSKMSEEELRTAHASAGHAYRESGDYPNALTHLVAAGDEREALHLADAHGAELFGAGRGRALVDLVKATPADVRAQHHRALYWAAVAASRMFDWDWAAAALAEAEAVASASGDEESARDALRSLAYMLNVWGRFGPAADAANRLIQSIPESQPAPRAAAALGHLVPGMTGAGQFTAAVALVYQLLPQLASEPRASADAEAFARSVAAVTLARDGDVAEAGAQLSLADALTPGCADDVVRTQVAWTRAMAGFLSGDTTAAWAAASRTEALALQVGDLQRVLECRALYAMVHLLRGETAAAERGFADVEELRAGITNFWVTILTLLSRPRRMLLAGDTAGALAAAESNLALAIGIGEVWFVCFSRLEVIHLLLLGGDAPAARDMARTALEEARALRSDLLRYGAALSVAASDDDAGGAALAEALDIADARDYRFVMPYAARLPRLDARLWHALGSERHVRVAILLEHLGHESAAALRHEAAALPERAALNAVATLTSWGAAGRAGLSALEHAAAEAAVRRAAAAAIAALDAANPHRLSARELEVLALLRQGLRTKDIAERLVLTPATVSTHIQRIMTKTGTTSRAGLLALAADRPVSGLA